MIACVQIQHFATAVERQLDGALRDVPLILVHYPKRQGRVQALSLEAEIAGIKPGMALSRARALAPKGAFQTAEPEHSEQALENLLAAFWTFTGQVEIDDAAYPQTLIAYLDLGPLNEATIRRLCDQLLKAVRSCISGAVSIGLAQGKFAAYAAARMAQEGQIRWVSPGSEAVFVAPYPVSLLPLSKSAERKLRQLFIRQIGELAVLSRPELVAQFGRKSGRLLYALAHGVDSRPVVPRRLPQAEFVERSFDEPVTERTRLDVVVHVLADDLARRLEGRIAAAHHLAVKMEFEGGAPVVERLHLLHPVATAEGILGALAPLLERILHQARQHGIRRIEITLMKFVPAAPRQLDLLTHRPAHQFLLDLTPALVARYGERFYEPILDAPGRMLAERRFTLRKVGTA